MKLYFDKRLKDPTYYGQQGFRNGKKVTSKNIKNFGKHSELLKITDDPEAYVREEIRKWNEEHRKGREEFTISLDFNERVPSSGDAASSSTQLNIGYFFLQYYMRDLHLKDFFRRNVPDKNTAIDCYAILRFLVYTKILDPLSRDPAGHPMAPYYEKPDFDRGDISRLVDLLAENSDAYLAHLQQQCDSLPKRDFSVLYYNRIHLYFASEEQREEWIDAVAGEGKREPRQNGSISREQHSSPFAEIGLLLDRRGIPVTMCLSQEGMEGESADLSLAREIQHMQPGAKLVYCADDRLDPSTMQKFRSMGCSSFLVTQSVSDLPDSLKQEKNDTEKSARKNRNREESIKEEESYDGYRAIVTNLTDPAKDIENISRDRCLIEDFFKIRNTDFNSCPANCRSQKSIRSHMLICFTALLVLRMLEVQLDDFKTPVPADDLITTLNNMTVANLRDVEYIALYEGSKALEALTRLTMLPLDRLHYRPKDLNSILRGLLQ